MTATDFKTEVSVRYEHGKRIITKKKIPIRKERVKIISIAGKPPTVTQKTKGGKPVPSRIHTREGVTPVLDERTGKITGFRVKEQPVGEVRISRGESITPEVQAMLEPEKTNILRDTLTKVGSSPGRVKEKVPKGDLRTSSLDVYKRPVQYSPTFRTVQKDYDPKTGEVIYQKEEKRIADPRFFHVAPVKKEESSPLFFKDRKPVEEKYSHDVGTLVSSAVTINKELGKPQTSFDRSIIQYSQFEKKVEGFKTRWGYNPKLYETSYKDFFVSPAMKGKKGEDKAVGMGRNILLDMGGFVATAPLKAVVMIKAGRAAVHGDKLVRSEFVRTGKAVPKAVVSSYDVSKPMGLFNVGMTLLAVRSVARSPSNLGHKVYVHHKATKFFKVKADSTFKFHVKDVKVKHTVGKSTIELSKIGKSKVHVKHIVGKSTFELSKVGKSKVQTTLYGDRISPKHARSLLYSDKPAKFYNQIQQNPLKPYSIKYKPTGQLSLTTNKVLAFDVKKPVLSTTTGRIHATGSFHPTKTIGTKVYVLKNNLWMEYNPKKYTMVSASKYQVGGFHQPLSFADKLRVHNNFIITQKHNLNIGRYLTELDSKPFYKFPPQDITITSNRFFLNPKTSQTTLSGGKVPTIHLKTTYTYPKIKSVVSKPSAIRPITKSKTKSGQQALVGFTPVPVSKHYVYYPPEINVAYAPPKTGHGVITPPLIRGGASLIKSEFAPVKNLKPINVRSKYNIIQVQKPSLKLTQEVGSDLIIGLVSLGNKRVVSKSQAQSVEVSRVIIPVPVYQLQKPQESKIIIPTPRLKLFTGVPPPPRKRVPPPPAFGLPKKGKSVFAPVEKKKEKKKKGVYKPTFYTASLGIEGKASEFGTVSGLGIRPVKKNKHGGF